MTARSNIIKLAVLAFVAMLLGGAFGGCGPQRTTQIETVVNPDGSTTIHKYETVVEGGSGMFAPVHVNRYSAPGYVQGRYVEWGTENRGVAYHSFGLNEPHKHVYGNGNNCNK